MLNLAMIVDDAARRHPDREAVVMGPTRLSYAELAALSSRVAHGLRDAGIGPGDKVALSCLNVPYFPIVYYGILKAGAVVVPLNVLLKPAEIAYHLDDSDAKAYFCFEGTDELPMARMGHAAFEQVDGCERFFVITADPAAASPIDGAATLGMLMHERPASFPITSTAPDDTAVILYTSGTTGRPKGAELSHANMYTNAIASRDLSLPELQAGEVHITLIALPLFHSFGQTCQMNAGVLGAGTLVLVPRFEPGAVLEAMAKEEVNLFSGVPTMFWGLLNHAREHGVDTRPIAENLKVCTSGGSAMPVEVLRAFEETFDVKILEGYGLSETSPVATFNHVDQPRKVGSIGRPISGVEVRIADEDGNDVPVGEPGEVVIRGFNVMKGYYDRPDATEAAFRDGWFRTGDIGRMDEDGYFYIVDRVKDMIIRGGYNVYPREVEEIMMEHPAVSMAAVLGVPDEESGEEIKAYVIREPGAELTEAELLEWCEERMAAYKYPRMVEFRDELPMSATGKILKRELRAEVEAAGERVPAS